MEGETDQLISGFLYWCIEMMKIAVYGMGLNVTMVMEDVGYDVATAKEQLGLKK